MQRRARLLRLTLLVAGVAVALVLSRHWPTDHVVHIVLGHSAPLVREVRVRYDEAHSGPKNWEREASFQYAEGQAPRVVSHELRVVSGDYDIEVDAVVAAPSGGTRTVTTARRTRLDSSAASIDVSQVIRDSLEDTPPPPPPPSP